MPDFSVRPTFGVLVADWVDPAVGKLPSRIAPSVAAPMRRWTIASTTLVELRATPDGGSEGAIDVLLDARLFRAWWVEAPVDSAVVILSLPERSSVQRFTPTRAGHYTLAFQRDGGGKVLLHFDCDS